MLNVFTCNLSTIRQKIYIDLVCIMIIMGQSFISTLQVVFLVECFSSWSDVISYYIMLLMGMWICVNHISSFFVQLLFAIIRVILLATKLDSEGRLLAAQCTRNEYVMYALANMRFNFNRENHNTSVHKEKKHQTNTKHRKKKLKSVNK